MTDPAPGRRSSTWLLPFALALGAAIYLWPVLDHGWYPHDEGTLGQAAERVLAGQLPHRDFTEVYTGGLAYLHAAAFRLFGITAMSLRYVLFGAYVAWVPLLFGVARRLVAPWPAAAIALLGAVWSVPLYPAAMPSWYSLFLVTAAAYAVLRFRETEDWRWCAAAGLACGLSTLVKLTGLFHLAGVLVACLLIVQEARPPRRAGERVGPLSWLIVGALVLVALALLRLTARTGSSIHVWFLGLPAALVCAVAAWRELGRAPAPPAAHWRVLARSAGAVALGGALPVALYAVPFLLGHGIDDLWRGVFALPAGRLEHAALVPRTPWFLLAALPAAGLVVGWRRAAAGSRLALLVALLVLGLAALARDQWLAYRAIWFALWGLGPIAVVAGVWWLARGAPQATPSAERPRAPDVLLVLVPILAFALLVQFPFMAPVYYAYVIPLVFVVGAGIAGLGRRLDGPVPAVVAAAGLVFAALCLRGGELTSLGYIFRPAVYRQLDLPRARLWVSPSDWLAYTQMGAVVTDRSRSPYIWAGPDAPEIYFLYAKANPGRAVYDFFETPGEQAASPLRDVETHAIDVVVIRNDPSFSSPIAPEVRAAFAARFPDSAAVRNFVVRWAP